MKKIKLKNITKADKSSFLTKRHSHSVSLGNGLTFYFSNINEVEAFLSELNRFLNYKLFELNEFFIEAFTIYQRNWFYFNNSEELKRDETRIQECIISFFKSLEILYSRSGWQNGNHFTFRFFYTLYDNIIFIAETVQALHKARNNFAESNIIEVIKKRVKSAKYELTRLNENDYFKERKYIIEKNDND